MLSNTVVVVSLVVPMTTEHHDLKGINQSLHLFLRQMMSSFILEAMAFSPPLRIADVAFPLRSRSTYNYSFS